MSNDDVRPNEMNEPHDFDEHAIEALLAGAGSDAAPQVADLVSDMRVAYTSIPPTPGAELSALMGLAPTAPAASLVSRRFERMRASMLARISAATAVVIAATGGLAVAQALPGPVQDLVAHVGIGGSSHHHSDAAPTKASRTTTTTDESTTSTVFAAPTTEANHGAVVSGVAHDDSNVGCEHGAAVSAVASDGRSNNDGQNAAKDNPQNSSHDGSCATPTTFDTSTPSSTSTTTSTTDNHGDEHGGTTPTSKPEQSGGDHGASHGSQSDSGNGGS